MFRTAAPIGASSAFPTRSRSSRSSRRCHARRANAFAARRCALRHGMTIREPGRGHPPAFAVHPGRPTDIGRTRASPMHAVVQNEPDRSDGTESRSLTSPRSAAKRIPGRSAIHVCNMACCVSVFFHSLVPVFDTSDPLKRLPGQLHLQSRSRRIQPCKERTMLHAARPRGHIRGRGQASCPVRKRECFETETHRRWRRHRRVGALQGGQSPYNRPTIGGARAPGLALSRGAPPPDRNPHSLPVRHEARAGYRLPHAVLRHRSRQPRVAMRGVPPGSRVAKRMARVCAVPLVHRANTLAFGHGAPACFRCLAAKDPT